MIVMGLCAWFSLADIIVDVGLDPPGGLAASNTPQMVMLTFDDAVNSTVFPIVQNILTNHWNPNGTPIQATFFVSTDWSDYWFIHRLHAQGHEIAIHTMTHTTGKETRREDWRAEIVGCRKSLSELARIPLETIRGFRAPFLEYNNESFHILNEQGLTYDSSITEAPGRFSESAARMIWPYTLDDGVRQDCWTGQEPHDVFPGLFEIPMNSLFDPDSAGWIAMDPPETYTDEEVLFILKTNLLTRINGNRSPMGIFLHAGRWAERTGVFHEFISWAQTYPHVWFVNLGSVADFMRNPVSVDEAAEFPPFVTVPYPPVPETETTINVLGGRWVRTCGEILFDYPAPDTIYRTYDPYAGGTAVFEIASQDEYYFEGTLTLTNNTEITAYLWEISFDLPGSTITWFSGTTSWSQEDETVSLSSQGGGMLAPGETYTLDFGGQPGETVQANTMHVTLYSAANQKPRLLKFMRTPPGQVTLEWDDSAFGYAVEQCTNGLQNGWDRVAEVHGRTFWTGPIPASATSVFYRLRGIP